MVKYWGKKKEMICEPMVLYGVEVWNAKKKAVNLFSNQFTRYQKKTHTHTHTHTNTHTEQKKQQNGNLVEKVIKAR
jgi:hypothetical protein